MSTNQKKKRKKTAFKPHLLDAQDRIKNFDEVNQGFRTMDEVIKECERCLQCFKKSDPEIKPPPCMKNCPTHCNTREIISNVISGNIDQALKIIYEHYPFPRSVERVCPGYCQQYCTSGKVGDPIQIPTIKRYLVDHYGLSKDFFSCKPNNGKKVAIIGSGPLGLSSAYFLKKLGFQVTIFEKLNVIGGMLISEIPEFRLPREVVTEEVNNLKKLGIEFKKNISIDEKNPITNFFESGYDVVVIGIGTHKAKEIGLPGEESSKVLQAIEFLKKFNLEKKFPDIKGKSVAVIGGGSTATDAARVAKRLGAEVSIIYRRKKEQMPAGKEEIEESFDEGIIVSFLTNPVSFICTEGELLGAVCQKMELGDLDDSGRPRTLPIENSNFKVDADFIIEAVGQEADLDEFDTKDLKITNKNTIKIDQNFITSIPKVLAGGDCVTGSKSVVDAVAHGKIITNQIEKLIES
jgi:NADPH-dependent glutamate synthase beta subunit-like oxidoreductase